MNIFEEIDVANKYDSYYNSEFTKRIDILEKELIKKTIKGILKGEMLELGFGTGHWTEFFIEQGFNITGVEISDAMFSVAKNKMLKANLLKGDSQKLPFKDESFPVISSITMMEFVEDQDKVLDEMFRVLKPKGRIILGCLNANSIIAKNKEQNKTFKDAKFLTIEDLKQKLNKFEEVKFDFGVYLDADFNLLDMENKKDIEPVFIVVSAQKKSKP